MIHVLTMFEYIAFQSSHAADLADSEFGICQIN